MVWDEKNIFWVQDLEPIATSIQKKLILYIIQK